MGAVHIEGKKGQGEALEAVLLRAARVYRNFLEVLTANVFCTRLRLAASLARTGFVGASLPGGLLDVLSSGAPF